MKDDKAPVPRCRRFEGARLKDLRNKKIEVPWGTQLLAVDIEKRKKLTFCCGVPRQQKEFFQRLATDFAQYKVAVYQRTGLNVHDCGVWERLP